MSIPPSDPFSSADVIPLLIPLLASQVSLAKRLKAAGLEIAIMENAWWWYLPSYRIQSAHGFETFGDAVFDGLRWYFRITDRYEGRNRSPRRRGDA